MPRESIDLARAFNLKRIRDALREASRNVPESRLICDVLKDVETLIEAYDGESDA